MKILVLYAMAGGGHKTAANAVRTYLENAVPDAQVRVEDGLKALSRHSKLVDWACCDTYKWMARRAPWIFGLAYRAADRPGPAGKVVPGVNAYVSRWLLDNLNEYQPDAVICTYHFSGQMISHLKEKGLTKTKLVLLITDYAPCMPWICKNADAYVVAAPELIPQMEERGVPAEKVYPFGIPVRPAFFEKMDRTAQRRDLGIDEKLPTVLLMAGSFGVKKVLQVYREIDALHLPMQLLVIAGNNKPLEDSLRRAAMGKKHPVLVRGFCSDVERYMRAADLLVTKPGGLTVSEALACGLPIAAFDAIPGQEEDNAAFLVQSGMGVRIGPEGCAATVGALLENPARLARMRAACEAFDTSGCMRDLPRLLARLTEKQGGTFPGREQAGGAGSEIVN